MAGDHVPKIPLFEVVGNAAKFCPEQIDCTCVKVGTTAVVVVVTAVTLL